MDCYGMKAKYIIGKRISAGGEGQVFAIEGRPDIVAKLYYAKKLTSNNLIEEKIKAMIHNPVRAYLPDANGNRTLTVAWPIDYLKGQDGSFLGFIMPRVESTHHIFSASREREKRILFPNYTWETALKVAYNLALAVKTVHDSGSVIGDLNSNNIMVDRFGHCCLIDCDSFTVTNNGKVFKCEVGVPEMLAPELQGKDLSSDNSVFTRESDCFSLAVHIFNLLMNNQHPFGYIGMSTYHSSSNINHIMENIAKGFCPYVTGLHVDSDAPSFDFLPANIKPLFERCFKYSLNTSTKRETILKRPTAEEWMRELMTVIRTNDLRTCPRNRFHKYPSHNNCCPWCEIEKKHKLQVVPPNSQFVTNNNTHLTKANTSHHSALPIINNYTNSKHTHFSDVWPLFLSTILTGVIISPFMAGTLSEILADYIEDTVDVYAVCVFLATTGALSGIIISSYLKENYYISPHRWLYSLGACIATPIGTVCLVLVLAILVAVLTFVIKLIMSIVLFVLGVAIAIALIAAFISGCE